MSGVSGNVPPNKVGASSAFISNAANTVQNLIPPASNVRGIILRTAFIESTGVSAVDRLVATTVAGGATAGTIASAVAPACVNVPNLPMTLPPGIGLDASGLVAAGGGTGVTFDIL